MPTATEVANDAYLRTTEHLEDGQNVLALLAQTMGVLAAVSEFLAVQYGMLDKEESDGLDEVPAEAGPVPTSGNAHTAHE